MHQKICVLDYETSSRYPHTTQPLQICAVMIDGRRLEIIQNSIFQSYIKPIPDNECEKFGLDKLEQEALEVNKITPKILEDAPSLEVVWSQFTNYVNQYNNKKDKWSAPVLAGYNNNKFDDIITDRICGGHLRYVTSKGLKEPYKFGPWDDETNKNKLFHPRDNIDIMKLLFYWFENDKDVNSYGLDYMRKKFGMDTSKAHDAVFDVLQSGYLLIKFLKLSRYVHERMSEKFNNCFDKENKLIAELMNNV